MNRRKLLSFLALSPLAVPAAIAAMHAAPAENTITVKEATRQMTVALDQRHSVVTPRPMRFVNWRSGPTSRRSIFRSESNAANERRNSISMASASLRRAASAPSLLKCSIEYPRGVRYGSQGPRRSVIGPALAMKAGMAAAVARRSIQHRGEADPRSRLVSFPAAAHRSAG